MSEVLNKWIPLLDYWGNKTTDEHELKILLKMRRLLQDLQSI
jgi:hypothetical protein